MFNDNIDNMKMYHIDYESSNDRMAYVRSLSDDYRKINFPITGRKSSLNSFMMRELNSEITGEPLFDDDSLRSINHPAALKGIMNSMMNTFNQMDMHDDVFNNMFHDANWIESSLKSLDETDYDAIIMSDMNASPTLGSNPIGNIDDRDYTMNNYNTIRVKSNGTYYTIKPCSSHIGFYSLTTDDAEYMITAPLDFIIHLLNADNVDNMNSFISDYLSYHDEFNVKIMESNKGYDVSRNASIDSAWDGFIDRMDGFTIKYKNMNENDMTQDDANEIIMNVRELHDDYGTFPEHNSIPAEISNDIVSVIYGLYALYKNHVMTQSDFNATRQKLLLMARKH